MTHQIYPLFELGIFQDHLRTAKLYRLHHPPVQARVRWAVYDNLLLDVARTLGVPVAQISGLHHVQVTPIGDLNTAASIIVQMLDDIDIASSDQLVLVDLEIHRHTPSDM